MCVCVSCAYGRPQMAEKGIGSSEAGWLLVGTYELPGVGAEILL